MSEVIRKNVKFRTEKNDSDRFAPIPKGRAGKDASYVLDPGNPNSMLPVKEKKWIYKGRKSYCRVNSNRKIDRNIHSWKYSSETRSNRGILSPYKDEQLILLGPPDPFGSGRDFNAVSITLPGNIYEKLVELATLRDERLTVTARKILEYMIENSPAHVEPLATERIVVNLTREFLDKAERQASREDVSRARLIVRQLEAFFEQLSGGVQNDEIMNDGALGHAPKRNLLLSADATPKLIGERLREERKRKGWTQLQLAKAMGLTTSRTVEELEHPRKGQSIIALHSALAALEIDGL